MILAAGLALVACTVQPLTPDPAWTQAAPPGALTGPAVERITLPLAGVEMVPTEVALIQAPTGTSEVSQIPTAIPYASPTADQAQSSATAASTQAVVIVAAVQAPPTVRRPAPTGVPATAVPPSPTAVEPTAVDPMSPEALSPTAPVVDTSPTAASVPPTATAPAPAASGGEVAAAEQYAIDLINQQRAAVGVAALVRDEALMAVARGRVADMVARGYTGHNDPVSGVSLGPVNIRAAGFNSPYIGENWYGTLRPPPVNVEVAMGWFMTDPPHARNILSPNYVFVGVGIAYNGRQWLLIQNFAGAN